MTQRRHDGVPEDLPDHRGALERLAGFRREGVESELAAVGLELIGWWTDPDGDYAISLSRKP